MIRSRAHNGAVPPTLRNTARLEEVDCLKYMGSQVAADGGCERDMGHRLNEQ